MNRQHRTIILQNCCALVFVDDILIVVYSRQLRGVSMKERAVACLCCARLRRDFSETCFLANNMVSVALMLTWILAWRPRCHDQET